MIPLIMLLTAIAADPNLSRHEELTITCEDGRYAPKGNSCKEQLTRLKRLRWIVVEISEKRGIDSMIQTIKLRRWSGRSKR